MVVVMMMIFPTSRFSNTFNKGHCFWVVISYTFNNMFSHLTLMYDGNTILKLIASIKLCWTFILYTIKEFRFLSYFDSLGYRNNDQKGYDNSLHNIFYCNYINSKKSVLFMNHAKYIFLCYLLV